MPSEAEPQTSTNVAPDVRPDEPDVRERIVRYLADSDRSRYYAIGRTLGAMDPHERALVREAAVMGYVRGAQASGLQVTIPKDSVIVEDVVAACLSNGDLYPHLAALAVPVRPPAPHESFASALLGLHRPKCVRCGSDAATCECDAPAVCSTCPIDDPITHRLAQWPCASVRLLGRIAVCENFLEEPDLTGHPCRGYLVFRPHDPQARCLSCGAWCGSRAATYLELP